VAHVVTAVRLLLAVPVALAMARPALLPAGVVAVLVLIAIATDFGDGIVARRSGSASAAGQLFDHATDAAFVTSALAGAAVAGAVPALLPILIGIAFGQYVLDSYWLQRRTRLRMSTLGRWNGLLYFVPIVVLAASRLDPLTPVRGVLEGTALVSAYALIVSTIASIADRALASVGRRPTG